MTKTGPIEQYISEKTAIAESEWKLRAQCYMAALKTLKSVRHKDLQELVELVRKNCCDEKAIVDFVRERGKGVLFRPSNKKVESLVVDEIEYVFWPKSKKYSFN